MTVPAPLLEREPLLRRMSDLLARAELGAGAFVLVGGEAGVGKTSLVRRFVDGLPPAATALWGFSEALQTPSPLAPLHDMIRQLDPATRERLAAAPDRTDLFSGFLGALAGRLAVLVFEDVHWADDATLDLLRFLVRRTRGSNMLVVATHRDDETGPAHPLRALLGDLATAGIERLKIEPLSVRAVSTLVGERTLDAGALHERTGGNPFFLTEVLAAARGAIPETVRDAVLARVLRATEGQREVLSLAAVVPRQTERWLVEEVLPGSAQALHECLLDGLLVNEADCVRFRHEIAREAVKAWLPPAVALGLHARVLARLELRSPAPLARMVHHAAAAGLEEAVVRHALPAAREAARAGAHREAAAHYATALASPAATRDRATWAGWLEARAYSLYLVGEIRSAVDCRLAAVDICRSLADTVGHGRNLRWLSRLHWLLGDNRKVESFGEAAVRQLEQGDPGVELAMAYSNMAQLHMLAERVELATLWGGRAIAMAQACDATDVLSHALNNLGLAQMFAGMPDGAAQLERSLRLALEHGFEEHVARAYGNLATGALVQRDYRQAMDGLAKGLAYSGQHGIETWLVYLTAVRSRAHFEQGRWDEAEADASEVMGYRSLGAILRIPAITVMAALRVRRGEAAGAALLDEARDIALPTGELQRIWPISAARAEAAWLAGDLAGCAREAAVGFALAREHQNRWALGETAFWLWRAGALDVLPDGCAEPFALQMRGDWRGAARAWQALVCPYEEAGALADGDENAQGEALKIFDRLGAQAAARRLRDTMHAQGRRGIPRGPRATTRANPYGLTARECDILSLLAQGKSNSVIAAQVHRSVRTVDHHVAAILGKLAVSTRGEAARRALEDGLLSPT